MHLPLEEAEGAIRDALERLCDKDEDLHPFVVIDKVGQKSIFVQFAGSRTRPLVFDVPLLDIVNDPCTIDDGARRAVETLNFLGVRSDERVMIHEEDDKPPPGRGEPLWRRLLFGST